MRWKPAGCLEIMWPPRHPQPHFKLQDKRKKTADLSLISQPTFIGIMEHHHHRVHPTNAHQEKKKWAEFCAGRQQEVCPVCWPALVNKDHCCPASLQTEGGGNVCPFCHLTTRGCYCSHTGPLICSDWDGQVVKPTPNVPECISNQNHQNPPDGRRPVRVASSIINHQLTNVTL